MDEPVLVDARGYRCPLPVVKAEAALRRIAPGASILVLADDPLAGVDLPHCARQAGCACEPADDGRAPVSFRITKPGGAPE